jgi:hypothetical protein
MGPPLELNEISDHGEMSRVAHEEVIAAHQSIRRAALAEPLPSVDY